ncbi:LysR substrate-binding domain-containing protein [Hylemonella gracilis]|uniref:Lysr substrate-binding protein n=1 Tax=Hylemonella gracilis ATCC 19624 TaxID=887062 RepID=F3KWY2_9BURK|nr:LysR substrate-binding domain-containing protein [Hylemonella gracilis]EGI75769.1 lysr substrate-binding protein [Hylemonella gracilis ATCC 19624]
MRRKLPSTQALACFEAAARHQSYTRAAQELALTQSAVSRQILALEDFLGLTLFTRSRHGVVLTAQGAAYARQVAQRLAALERDTLDAMAQQGDGAHGGVIALAAVATFATRWLIPRLPRLTQAHPDMVVHIETRTRPFLFADQEFDAALYAGTADQMQRWAGTQATALMAEEVLPVCSPALLQGAVSRRPSQARPGLTPSQIASLPLLQQSTRPTAWRQWFEAQGVDTPRAMAGPRHELFSMTAMAAAHGLGVALVPTMLIEEELARGELVVASPRPLKSGRTYYYVTPEPDQDQVERTAVSQLRDWLLAQAQSPARVTASG